MTRNEAQKLAGMLVGMFPQATSDQANWAIKTFQRFRVDTVKGAIEEHAGAFTFLTPAELLKSCEQAEREPDASPTGRAAMPDQSYADIVRAQDPQLRNVASDVEVILRSYRKQWHACGQRAGYRVSLKRQCSTALLVGTVIDGAPFTPDGADAWAETIFADVPTMKAVLEDLRTRHTSGPAPKQSDESPWRQSFDGIRGHFELAWAAVVASEPDGHGLNFVRATLMRHAIGALLSLSIDEQRLSPQDAEEMARTYVGLKPGERMPWPEPKFATAIPVELPPTNFDALKDLARHEYAEQKALPDPAAAVSVA